MFSLLYNKKILLLILLGIILVSLPLTLLLVQQQQETRSKAELATTLAFQPASTTTTPIQKNVNDVFSLDMLVNPGQNQITLVKFEISYDATKITALGTRGFTPNTTAFPITVEGPFISETNNIGKIQGTVSIGSDYSKTIIAQTVVGSIEFKAKAATSGSPTQISFTTNAQVLSLGSSDQASENVLSSTSPAFLQITAAPTPTTTSVPCSPTGGTGGSAVAGPGITVRGGNGGSGTSTGGVCKPGTNGYSLNASNYCTTKGIAITWPTTNTATYYKLLIDGIQVYNGSGLSYTATNYSAGPQHTITLYAGNTAVGDFNPSTGGYFQIASTACAAPTPTPTSVPPSLTFTAAQTSLPYNGSTTLNWNSTNATACTASNGWTGTKTVDGTQSTGILTSSKTYTLTCTGPGGSISKSVTITVAAAPTPTPTRTPTPTATPVPTNTPVPTATPVPQATKFKFVVYLHGLGNSGDNRNPTAHSLSNKNPVRQQRSLDVEVLTTGATRQRILQKSFTAALTYNAQQGYFEGTVDMGTTLASGVYNINIHTYQYLWNSFAGIQINTGQINTLPPISLVSGDVNNDDVLDIDDYNIITGCYSDFGPAVSCPATTVPTTPFLMKDMADLTDDGKVNQFDYNLFLREYSVQNSNRITL